MKANSEFEAGHGNEIRGLLETLELAPPQSHGPLTVVPLLAQRPHAVSYLSLAETMAAGRLLLTELDQGGTVAEIRALNRTALPVLLVDGEEIRGAKQNRALNASFLLKEQSHASVPVTCTERRRWRYQSPCFVDANLVMAHQSRASKCLAVSESLAAGQNYFSDQAEAWRQVLALHKKLRISSPTEAMKDAFDARMEELLQMVAAVPLLRDQRGLVVLYQGRVAGFDYVSSAAAYAQLHTKLIKSYGIEVLGRAQRRPLAEAEALRRARAFLALAGTGKMERYPSIGYGESIRFQSRGQIGVALVHEAEVIHLAAFNPLAKG